MSNAVDKFIEIDLATDKCKIEDLSDGLSDLESHNPSSNIINNIGKYWPWTLYKKPTGKYFKLFL